MDGTPDDEPITVDWNVALRCVAEAEDKDTEADFKAEIKDVRFERRAALDTQITKALKHLDHFFGSHLKKIKSPIIGGRHLTCCGVKTSGTTEDANVWQDQMISGFFQCLHTANKCLDPDKGPVSCQTATGMASRVKRHCTDKFHPLGLPPLNVFCNQTWRELRAKPLEH